MKEEPDSSVKEIKDITVSGFRFLRTTKEAQLQSSLVTITPDGSTAFLSVSSLPDPTICKIDIPELNSLVPMGGPFLDFPFIISDNANVWGTTYHQEVSKLFKINHTDEKVQFFKAFPKYSDCPII